MSFLMFVCGVAILLLSMRQLEAALARLGEGQLRRILVEFTGSPLQGVAFGTVSTAILQSSSIVGLMTMAFVGAGVLPLRNGIGVILGSNLGTTFTGWLVAWLGFKVDLAGFYVLLLGAGALLSLAGRPQSKLHNGGQFLLAFGLLLLALVLMKDGIVFVVDMVDIGWLRDIPLIGFLVFGILLTALIQSSSATMMITLSALSTGLLQLEQAAAVVVGADMGTTSTVILGSLSGMQVKRRIALVHFLFNLAIGLLAFLFLPQLLFLVRQLYGISDPLFSLVALHSSMNLFGIVLFLPGIGLLQALVERWVPVPQAKTLLISQVDQKVPAAAIAALEQDVRSLLRSSVLLNGWRLGILESRVAGNRKLLAETPQASYAELKYDENQLTDYLLELQRLPLQPEEATRSQQLLVCIRDCLYSTKAVKDSEADIVRFRLESGLEVRDFIDRLLAGMERLYLKVLELLDSDGAPDSGLFDELLDAVSASHSISNSAIYRVIDQQGLPYDRASSALNINRELLLSAHSLINALEQLLQPGAAPETLSQRLNGRVNRQA